MSLALAATVRFTGPYYIIVSPHEESDPDKWLTELQTPVEKI